MVIIRYVLIFNKMICFSTSNFVGRLNFECHTNMLLKKASKKFS